jgi:hypothetical protein
MNIYLYFDISVYCKFILYSVKDDDMRPIMKKYDTREWTGYSLATNRVKKRGSYGQGTETAGTIEMQGLIIPLKDYYKLLRSNIIN